MNTRIATHFKGNMPSSMWIGAAALAGLAVLYALPKTRKMAVSWVTKGMDFLKSETPPTKSASNWQQQLATAENLKGPVEKRKDASRISADTEATSHWKDDWSSE